ncbi:hypothetical protein TNCV_1899521 [Trichonephila clavipes]|nr:hypothetical protein TNCV_1899521 [Trichonephila clavipes]
MRYLDYQQPSEKDIVQPEDISNVPTEKCLESVGFEFEKCVDVVFPTFWSYIGNNGEYGCLPNGQAFVAYPHRPMTLHSPTENSLAVLNHKILEANSYGPKREIRRSPNVSFNKSIVARALCDMLRRLVGTTAPGHHDCSIQE